MSWSNKNLLYFYYIYISFLECNLRGKFDVKDMFIPIGADQPGLVLIILKFV